MGELKDLKQRIQNIMDIAAENGQAQGEDAKAWVIDQMVRAALGCRDGIETREYIEFVEDYEDGMDGPGSFVWNVGTAP